MYMKLKDGKSKVFCMSYDDGFFHDIRFVETINKYGLKATLHLNTGTWWDEDMVRDRPRGKLKLSEAKALYIGGPHELACHGQHHRFMEQLKPQEVLTEILENRRDIERDFGVLSLGLGMPYGTYTEDVIEMAKMCGMEYVRAGGATNKLTFPTDWYHFRTTCRHNHPQLMEFAHQFVRRCPTGTMISTGCSAWAATAGSLTGTRIGSCWRNCVSWLAARRISGTQPSLSCATMPRLMSPCRSAWIIRLSTTPRLPMCGSRRRRKFTASKPEKPFICNLEHPPKRWVFF